MSIQENDCVEIGNVVLQSFTAKYKELPILWNLTDPNYKNKIKRNAALLKLLSIYEKCKPGAKMADVRWKINTLRCNYRKELKKIEESKRSSARVNNVWSLSSWVFHALKFINKFEQFDEKSENPSEIQAIPCLSWSSMILPPEPMPKRAKSIGPVVRGVF